jgi:pimeloyl-ACP methyl ester carboxylesterase
VAPGPLEITAPRGGTLQVLVSGPDDGLPFIFHTGTPAGPVASGPMAETAAERGLRTILYARPGYAGSTPQPGRRVADAAADAAAVLDELQVGRFITAGWSGGGPHALACAALLPGRCLAAACMASPAPHNADGLDWLEGMGPENIDEYTAAREGVAALTGFIEDAAGGLATVTGTEVAAGLGGLLSGVDKASLSDEFADYLAASFRAALQSGIEGWRDDDLAFVSDWGFAPAEASKVPVAVWQGDADLMVPFSHGAWLASHVPGARGHLLPGEGHLTLAGRTFGAVLDDLAGMAGLDAAGR